MRTDAMLTLDQKAHILRRAGIAVPARPEVQMTAGHQERAASPTPDPGRGWESWEMQVEARYAQYVLARATRSLRQAEMSLQMGAAPHPSQRTQNA